MAHLASLGGITPEEAVCLATGNTARVHRARDGDDRRRRARRTSRSSTRRRGRSADTALGALAIGDLPGVGMILIDGKPVVGRSRNTPPAGRAPEVVKGQGVGGAGH